MKIRSQLIGAGLLALAVGIATAAALWIAGVQEDRAERQQQRAQTAAREVASLLFEAQDYARQPDAQTARQWQRHHAALLAALADPSAIEGPTGNEVPALREMATRLPMLFERLAGMAPPLPGTAIPALQAQRRELVVDQLLTDTHGMADAAYRWAREAAAARRLAETVHADVAASAIAALLLLLLGQAIYVYRAVLRPLRRAQRATEALERGELDTRIATDARNEIGSLGRSFDSMAAALGERTEQLVQAERRLRAITDNMPALVAYIDREQRFRFVNAHFMRVSGLPAERLIGMTIGELQGPVDYAPMRPYVEAALRGEQVSFETSPTRFGRTVWFAIDFVPERLADGTVDGFYAMLQDITERKTAELERIEARRRLRAITDNVPALITQIDVEGRLTFVNAHAGKVYGVEPDSLLGRTIVDMRGEEVRRQIEPYVERVLRGEAVAFESHSTIRGALHYFQQNYVPDFAPEGDVRGFYSVSIDITERKLAELASLHSEERIRSILTHAPDAFVSIDTRGRITEWNRQAEQTFGWTRADALGQTVDALIIPPAHRQAHRDGHARFLLSGTGPVIGQRLEVMALHRDGREIPVELSIAALKRDGGYIANAFLHDISERRTAEAAIAASQKLLRDITNNIPAHIGYFDAELRCRFANDPALRAHGIARGDELGRSLRDALGENDWAQLEPHLERVLAGQRCRFEGRTEQGGRAAFYQSHLVPELGDDGRVRGFYLMSFDVTALKAAEEARATGEQRLHAITSNLPVLISYIDADERLRYINTTIKDWLGVDPAVVIGGKLVDVIGPEFYEQRRVHLKRALGGERVVFDLESEALGVRRHLRNEYIPDMRPDGSVAGIYTLSSDVSAMKEVELHLERLTRTDSLTGLANRREFGERLAAAMARVRRSGKPLGLMFLDVDRFKAINDDHGHGVGDEVLQTFAQRLLQCVRGTDTVARLAGDEFTIVLEGLHGGDEPRFVAQKIVDCMSGPFATSAGPLPVSTSIGVAVYDGGTETIDAMLARADAALYEAKRGGRNMYRVARAG